MKEYHFDSGLDTQGNHLYEIRPGYIASRDVPKISVRSYLHSSLLEPHHVRARPLGTCGEGPKYSGFFTVPNVGAEVAVLFYLRNTHGSYCFLPSQESLCAAAFKWVLNIVEQVF